MWSLSSLIRGSKFGPRCCWVALVNKWERCGLWAPLFEDQNSVRVVVGWHLSTSGSSVIFEPPYLSIKIWSSLLLGGTCQQVGVVWSSSFELFIRWKNVCCGLVWLGCGAVISLLSWSWTWSWVQKGKRIALARLERIAKLFLTAMASWNGGGCAGFFSPLELTMSCSYISQVDVVTHIVPNAEFLWASGGEGSLEVACWWCSYVSIGVGMSRFKNQYERVLRFSELKWICLDLRMIWLRGVWSPANCFSGLLE